MDDERSPIPPRGRELELRPWAQLVTDYARHYLPGLRAAARTGAVTWELPPRRAILDISCATWFVTFEQDGRRTGAGLSIERHDVFTAENLGATLVGFFDPELSRPGHRRA